MRTLIDSLVDHVVTGPDQYDTYFATAPEAPEYPYVLVWAGAGRLEAETVAESRFLRDRVGVTVVATTPEGALAAAGRVRARLIGFTPDSDSWRVDPLREPYDSRPVERDRDVSIPGHGFPAFVVDMYDLTGTPL